MRRVVLLGVLAPGLAWSWAAAAAVDESAIQCIECHVDVEDAHVALIAEWRSSIHYAEGVTCGRCHGMSDTDFDALPDPGEGAHTKPDYQRTLAMCAQCHQDWIDYYPLSAHFQQKHISCVLCHGGSDNNHAIQRATLDIITEERCAECHSFERAREVKAALASAERAEIRLDAIMESLAANGYHSTRLEGLHDASHVLGVRVPLELHTFQLRRIKAITRSITGIEESMTKEKDRILTKLALQGRRQKIGFLVVLFCFGLSGLILAYRETYMEAWRATHGLPRREP